MTLLQDLKDLNPSKVTHTELLTALTWSEDYPNKEMEIWLMSEAVSIYLTIDGTDMEFHYDSVLEREEIIKKVNGFLNG